MHVFRSMKFQPIWQFSSDGQYKSIIGYEALLDSNNNEELFKHFNADLEIDCIMSACIMANRYKILDNSKKIFLNASLEMLRRHGELIKEFTAGLSPEKIVIEITEHNSFYFNHKLSLKLQELAQTGFSFAIDDFGSGIRPWLVGIRPAYIKTSRFLIRDCDQSSSKQLMLRSLITSARMLGTEVIMEGVETEAELTTCLELGSRLVQGYYTGKPARITELNLNPP